MYSPNLWILNMFCLSSHFPKPWKDRTFPNRLQKQKIFPALSGSLETQVHKLHDGICRKIKRTQVIQGFFCDLMFMSNAYPTLQSDKSSEGRFVKD